MAIRRIDAIDTAVFAFPELNAECLKSVVIPIRITTDTIIVFRPIYLTTQTKLSEHLDCTDCVSSVQLPPQTYIVLDS